jgi:hypothetical protein
LQSRSTESPGSPLVGPTPTLADIGALCVFHDDATARLEEMGSYLSDIREDATNRLASLFEEADDA